MSNSDSDNDAEQGEAGATEALREVLFEARCPKCGGDVPDGADSCPRCGLICRGLDAHCGVIPQILSNVTDLAEDFALGELQDLRRLTDRFDATFGETHLNIVATRVPPAVSLPAYGFWLLNRARIGAPPTVPPARNYSILFLLDSQRGDFSITVGYGMETLVSQSELEDVLAAGLPDLQQGKKRIGISKCISSLTELIQQKLQGKREIADADIF